MRLTTRADRPSIWACAAPRRAWSRYRAKIEPPFAMRPRRPGARRARSTPEMRCHSRVSAGFPRSCSRPARISSSSAPSARSTAAVRSACRASPSRATTKRTVCWTRSRTSDAEEQPGDGHRRCEDQSGKDPGCEQEDEQQQERAVLLIGSPRVLLARRQQTVDDIRAVERRDRDKVEDREHAVELDDREKDLFVGAADQRRSAKTERDRAQRGEREVRDRPGDREQGHTERRAKTRLVEWHRFAVTETSEDQQQTAERIEVRHRVQAEATEKPRRVVTEAMRGVRVHELVHRDAEDQGDDPCDEADRIPRRVLNRRHERAAHEAIQQQGQTEEQQRIQTAGTADAATCADHSSSVYGGQRLAMRPRTRRRGATRRALHRNAARISSIASASSGLPATWTSAYSCPRSTRSPTFACRTTPVRRSIGSPFFSRPAPSRTDAWPTRSAAIAPTNAVRAATRRSTRGARGRRPGSSTARASPPCAATSSRSLSRPLPSVSARSMIASARLASRALRPRTSISAPARRASRTRSPGPRPCSVSIASATSSALPTARPSGWSMSVSSQVTARPCATPIATIARARARADRRSFMNAPLPTFTSSTTAFAPAAIFFNMMLDAMSEIAGTLPVASRNAYNRPSAGASSFVCPVTTMPMRPSCARNSAVVRSTR